MARRDIVVVGASMGGPEALGTLVGSLPPDLNAAVLAVVHLAPNAKSVLAERLDRVAPFPAADAAEGEPVVPKRIYVAVPGRHLLVENGRIRLARGPRENHARPSVDALFRSAAFHFGARTIGIVLTGLLDDGTAGLWAIKDRGGIAIAQAPTEAAYPSMPMSAIRHVRVDRVLEVARMGDALRELTRRELAAPQEQEGMGSKNLEIEASIARGDQPLDPGVRALGKPSFSTCPDCHGSMVAINDGEFLRFRCHTGHGYTAQSLHERGMLEIDSTLWATLAQLEEQELLLHQLRETAHACGNVEAVVRYSAKSADVKKLAQRLRALAIDPALEPTSAGTAENTRRGSPTNAPIASGSR